MNHSYVNLASWAQLHGSYKQSILACHSNDRAVNRSILAISQQYESNFQQTLSSLSVATKQLFAIFQQSLSKPEQQLAIWKQTVSSTSQFGLAAFRKKNLPITTGHLMVGARPIYTIKRPYELRNTAENCWDAYPKF